MMDGTRLLMMAIMSAVGIIAVALLVIRSARIKSHLPAARREFWHDLMRRMGGRLFVRGKRGRLEFVWQGHGAEFREHSKGLQLEISCAGVFPNEVRVEEIRKDEKEPVAEEPLKRWKVKGVPGTFAVFAEKKMHAAELLTEEVRKTAFDSMLLRRFHVTPKGLMAEWRPGREKRLTTHLVGALKLAMHAKYAFAEKEGIDVMSVKGVDRGECQICGSELGGTVVHCTKCGTPHHEDCWEYVGVCSTYACGGAAARRA